MCRRIARVAKSGVGVGLLLVAVAAAATGASSVALDRLVRRPLRVPSADKVVLIRGLARAVGSNDPIAYWGTASALDALATFDAGDSRLESQHLAEWIRAAHVSPSFFDVFDIRPWLGEWLSSPPAAGAVQQLVLGHELARRAALLDEGALGTVISLGGMRFALRGVAPAGFAFPAGVQAWVLSGAEGSTLVELGPSVLARRPVEPTRGFVGRTAQGFTAAQLRAQLEGLQFEANRELSPHSGVRYGQGVGVVPVSDVLAAPVADGLRAFGLASALVLVVALSCLTSAAIMFREATSVEAYIQEALGASPSRLLSETGVVAAVLGAACVAVAAAAASALVTSPAWTSLVADAVPAPGMVSASIGAAALVAAACAAIGLTPLFGRRPSVRGATSSWLRAALALQIGVAVTCGAGALSSLSSITSRMPADYGFDVDHTAVAEVIVAPNAARAGDGRLPAASIVSSIPLQNAAIALLSAPPYTASAQRFLDVSTAHRRTQAVVVEVSGDFASALGLAVAQGTGVLGSEREVVISEATSRRLFLDGNAIGQYLRLPSTTGGLSVVGVVRNTVPLDSPGQSVPQVYRRASTTNLGGVAMERAYVVARCATECAALTSRLRMALDSVVALAVQGVWPVSELRERAVEPLRRTAAAWVVYFTLCLSVGIASALTLAQLAVALRTREIAVRVALGVGAAALVRVVVGRTIVTLMLGIAIGVFGSLSAGRLLTTAMAGVAPVTLRLVAEAAILVAVCTVGATCWPVWRMTTQEPATLLGQSDADSPFAR